MNIIYSMHFKPGKKYVHIHSRESYLGELSQYHVESIFFVNVNNQNDAPVPIDDFNNDGINPL